MAELYETGLSNSVNRLFEAAISTFLIGQNCSQMVDAEPKHWSDFPEILCILSQTQIVQQLLHKFPGAITFFS